MKKISDADLKLKESEKKFRTFVDTATDLMNITDKEGNFTDVNKAMVDTLGYSRKELLGMRIPQILSKKSVKKDFKPNWKKLIREGGIHIETTCLTKNGKEMPSELKAVAIYDNGRFAGTRAVILDLTERKKAEETIIAEATHRRILMEQSHDGIVVLKKDGSVYESNQRFADMIGFSPEEVSHLHVWDWEFKFTREQVQGMLRNVDETGDHFETKHRRKDGTIYDVEISTNAAVFEKEKLIFCVCRDITSRKKAEEDLRKRNEELEKFNRLTVGRELKMVELKKEINEFCKKLGEKSRYSVK